MRKSYLYESSFSKLPFFSSGSDVDKLAGKLVDIFMGKLVESGRPYANQIYDCLSKDKNFALDLFRNPNESFIDRLYECIKKKFKIQDTDEKKVKKEIKTTIIKTILDTQTSEKAKMYMKELGIEKKSATVLFKELYASIKDAFTKMRNSKVGLGIYLLGIIVLIVLVVKKLPVIGKFFGKVIGFLTFPFRWLLSKFRGSPNKIAALFEQYLYNPKVRKLVESHNRTIEMYGMLYSML